MQANGESAQMLGEEHFHTSQTAKTPNETVSHNHFEATPPTMSAPLPHHISPQSKPHAPTSSLNPSSSPQVHGVPQSSNSAASFHQKPPQSPKLMKKTSRSSLGGETRDENKLTPKRSISNLVMGLNAHKRDIIEESVPLTAAETASNYFAKQLALQPRGDKAAETAVILHDACYGHRYSRLRTTKSTLAMIVERPERIHASVLGASVAHVRMGKHHCEAENPPNLDTTDVLAPPFEIRRSTRLMDITSSHVTNVHGTAWMSELNGLCGKTRERLAVGAKELEREPSSSSPGQQKHKLHEGDLYLAPESLQAFQGALGGVADAVDAVFQPDLATKRAFVAVRPPGHHCSADHPSGFCWLNNVHVGIEYAAQTYSLTHAAILDFDLHHGDGSQAITWERNSKNNARRLSGKANSKGKLGPDIGYYSLHDINSYPCESGDDEKVQAASLCVDRAHGQSVWNVHLQEWKTETEFWQLYESRYSVLIDKARGFLRHHTSRLKAEGKLRPRAAVFISAGFDASEWEGAGMQRHKVNVPTEFYSRFTSDVVQLALEENSGCDGRVISVLEGGYSDRALCSGVISHLSGLCMPTLDGAKAQPSPAPSDLDQMMRGLCLAGSDASAKGSYDKSWWSQSNLSALELKVNPPPPAAPKKGGRGSAPTYATPTESFAYKVVDTDKFARSISGSQLPVSTRPRPPPPPPPEIDWILATQELHKLLIPTDRQTRSCTSEELAGPKTKKEPALPPTVSEEQGRSRQLRTRKAKAPTYAEEMEALRSTSASRDGRRQTIADFPLAEPAAEPGQLQRRASRRLSAGSTLSSRTTEADTDVPPVPPLWNRPATALGAAKTPPMGARPGVQVKKVRAPSGAKSSVAAGSTSRTVSASVPGSSASTGRSVVPSGTGAAQASTNGGDADDAVAKLTSGVKNVTLKVGTREEHDRKQEKLNADRRARALKAAETRKLNAAKKAAGATAAGVSDGGRKVSAGAPVKDHKPAPASNGPSPAKDAKRSGSSLEPLASVPTSIEPPESRPPPAVGVRSQGAPALSWGAFKIPDKNDPTIPLTASIPRAQNSTGASFIADPAAAPASLPRQDYPPGADDHGSLPSVKPSASPDDPFYRDAHQRPREPLPAADTFVPPASRPEPEQGVPSSPSRPLSRARGPNGETLPTWSATSAIIFAPLGPENEMQSDNSASVNATQEPGAHAVVQGERQVENAASMWDVPVTPRP